MKRLGVVHIVEINDKIYQKSLANKEIEYSGKDEYTTSIDKIKKLVKSAPKKDLVDTATYYLKNIILLQAFPNANHRTAICAVELFLKMNGMVLKYTLKEALEFHRTSFSIQSRVYGSLEARGTTVLNEGQNEFSEFCRKFLELHLTKGD